MSNSIKYYLLIFIILLSKLLFPQQVTEWKNLESPTDQLLNKLFFIDNNTGWAEGDGATIINTTDGGISWNTLYSAVDTYILDIFFLNENLGWVLFWDSNPPIASKILKTTNGGLDWVTEICPGENTFFRSIYFLDSLTGFVAGSKIFKTTDGGEYWFGVNVSDVDTIPPDFSMLPVNKIDFSNSQIGYACGGHLDLAGVIWWTTDGGYNWTAKRSGPDPINDFYIFDSLNVIGLGGDPEGFFGIGHVKTSDGGINWNFTELNLTGVVNAMSFRTPAEGWAVKDDKFIFSVDSGTVWVEINTPGNVLLKDLIFTDSSTGYAIGNSGTILKYIPSLTIADESINAVVPNNFSLSQNYPNPFNPTTKIRYTIPSVIASEMKQSQLVTLKVYDVLGTEIATIVNEEKIAGNHTVEFNASSLPSGVYFYQLKAGDFIQTNKMILMK